MKHTRLMESQQLLREVMAEALGIYMSKEPAELDNWREKNIWQLTDHLAHEIGEIRMSDTSDRKYHNALDAISLAAMIAVKVRLEVGEKLGFWAIDKNLLDVNEGRERK